MQNKKLDADIEELEKHFPKGDKKRGYVMLILSLARREGRKEGYNKAIKEVFGEEENERKI